MSIQAKVRMLQSECTRPWCEGRWDLKQIVGAGGHGVVVRAYDKLLDAAVAIKVFRADAVERGDSRRQNEGQEIAARQGARFTSVEREGLEREAALMQQLQHPCVIRFFEAHYNVYQELHFMVVEYAYGEPLSQIIQQNRLANRSLPEPVTVAIQHVLSVPTHCTYTRYSLYTVLIHCTHTLYSYNR
jgi:serine/threonine protein kinase